MLLAIVAVMNVEVDQGDALHAAFPANACVIPTATFVEEAETHRLAARGVMTR